MPTPFNILGKNETYAGRSYSEWVESWSNLLVSSNPDNQSGEVMLFTRGNIDYKTDESGQRVKEPGKFLDRTGSLGETIYQNSAVFIPVITAMMTLNEPYEGRPLLDEQALRYAVRKDISEGGNLWLRYRQPGTGWKQVFTGGRSQIKDYYFESRVFTLNVASDSPLVGKFEYALAPNSYESVQGGFFIILKDLTPGKYRFHFGGFGRGIYYTDSVYDITVLNGTSRYLPDDISNTTVSTYGSSPSQKEKAKKSYLHLKIEDDIDITSPF